MLKAAIFDMDGLLVDSEPHWRSVEREVFGSVGLTLTDEQCKQTTGMPIPAVVEYWYARFPWNDTQPGQTKADIGAAITAGAHQRIGERAEPMPGAIDLLNWFVGQGIATAIASASPMSLIEVVVDRMGIRNQLTLWHSATLEARNKPAPDVYLGTARQLSVRPDECVAFEDSGAGVTSAKGAGMLTVAVPADFERDDPKFAVADLILVSLHDFSAETLTLLENTSQKSAA
ncbi:hexitol phosphatase HxpB [Spirosoma montaniterrae]|uniref:Haloacid dehalogenase n=1 Tax=Spirosoma montaniterrae TaxID=1178516 RepID=A0A1P9WTU8_9BACT|nr:hexitol phosphatase HxpB [Spirosoma montaniterrae]AQG78760.1 haloacid dehalogenase [Spirosoma montaniterrae]